MALQTLEEAKEFVDPELFTVMRLLQENNGLLQSIADCQRTGRIQDAQKLQDLLQKNLVFLSNEVDPSLVAELQTVGICSVNVVLNLLFRILLLSLRRVHRMLRLLLDLLLLNNRCLNKMAILVPMG